MKLTITRGLPGSGKTTWAKDQIAGFQKSIARVNRDDLRRMLHGAALFSHETEKQVTWAQQSTVEQLLRSGVSVIVDDTNLRSRYVRAWVELADRMGAEFEVKDFTDIPVDTCIQRDSERPLGGGRVGPDVIHSMHQRYLAGRSLPLPIPELTADTTGRPYVPVDGTSLAVMVDIDGTVALHGDRDPYDTSRYHEDGVNLPVVLAVKALFDSGHDVIMCSGRDEAFRTVTDHWLYEQVLKPHGLPYAELHMRPEGDKRRDDVVKLELFDKHIRDQYTITCVFDDRDRVVKAWRYIGLTVFQVADGNF
jgi:predicted kinase